jgi:hypothetical protein
MSILLRADIYMKYIFICDLQNSHACRCKHDKDAVFLMNSLDLPDTKALYAGNSQGSECWVSS